MITDEMLVRLRLAVSERLSKRRFEHTLGVERSARLLAEHCLPERKNEISAAALLHDITKEFSYEEHLRIVSEAEIELEEDVIGTPAVLHSFTAPAVVKSDFAEFATEDLLSAIRNHTLGEVSMSVFDKIIFLADFIEDGRSYPDSIKTAKYVKEFMREGDLKNNRAVLDRACLMEFESTVAHLKASERPINRRTLLAMNSILSAN